MILLAGAMILGSIGCSTFTVTAARPYFQTAVHPEASRDGMLRAARRVLVRSGWQSVQAAAGSYRIRAVTSEGPGMRNTLALEVKEHGEVLLWLRTELQDEQGQWIAPATVCDSYSFSRERELADRIARVETRHRQRTTP